MVGAGVRANGSKPCVDVAILEQFFKNFFDADRQVEALALCRKAHTADRYKILTGLSVVCRGDLTDNFSLAGGDHSREDDSIPLPVDRAGARDCNPIPDSQFSKHISSDAAQ